MSVFSKFLLYFTLFLCFHYNTLAQATSFFDKSGKPTNEENAYYIRKLISGDTCLSNNVNLCIEGKIIKLDKTGYNYITTIFQWETCGIYSTSKVLIIYDFYTGIGIRSSYYGIHIEQNTNMETKYIKTNQREGLVRFSNVKGYSI